MTVTDHTPPLADLEPAGWTEPEIQAELHERAEDEWINAQPDTPSDVLAAEWAEQEQDTSSSSEERAAR